MEHLSCRANGTKTPAPSIKAECVPWLNTVGPPGRRIAPVSESLPCPASPSQPFSISHSRTFVGLPPFVRSFRFERTGSSLFDEVVAPRLNRDGTFVARSEGRKIRVYRSVDTRLMLNDFFAKMRVNFSS